MALDTTPQQVTTTALQALPFESLIGGPLKAAISAQALAAKTTWEFIKEVGLWDDPKTGEKKAVNVTFMYQRGGETVNLVVPLLTIVPIPYIAVDKITIDFMANISASASSVSEQTTAETTEGGGGGTAKVGWGPFSANVDFHANYSSKKDSKSSQDSRYSVEYTMNVHVAASQSSMPAGLGAVLNILQGSITEAKPGGSLEPTPKASQLLQRVGADESSTIRFVVKSGHGELLANQDVNFSINKGKADKVTVAVIGADGSPKPFTGGAQKTDAGGGVTLQVTVPSTDDYTENVRITISAVANIQNPPQGPDAKPPPVRQVDAVGYVTIVPKPKLPPVPNTGLQIIAPNNGKVTLDGNATNAVAVKLSVKRDGKDLASGKVSAAIVSGNNAVEASTLNTPATVTNGEATFNVKKGATTTGGETASVEFTITDGNDTAKVKVQLIVPSP
ncbi:MAG TPA: DUF2589 domain-containing protein [Polyangium sp.]|nr:DUF2589 domain-containing protein [Polyangium sp.]